MAWAARARRRHRETSDRRGLSPSGYRLVAVVGGRRRRRQRRQNTRHTGHTRTARPQNIEISIGRLREGCDVSDCLPMHSARGYGEYGPCVSYCDCPNRLSKVGSPRASFELLAEPRHFGEAGGPALHLRTCTHTDSSADTPSTDIRTMYSSSKVSRAAPRWISISPARRRSRRRDRRDGREGRRSLPHRLHGRTREAMAGAVATRRQPGKVRGLETALAESACSAAGCRRRRRRVAPQMESEIERLGFGCRIV